MSQPNPLPTPTEQLGYHDAHGDAERGDRIDHFPGALKEAEEAAQRGGMKGLTAEQSQAASGTVNLLHRYGDTDKDNIVLIPAPTADPQGKGSDHSLLKVADSSSRSPESAILAPNLDGSASSDVRIFRTGSCFGVCITRAFPEG